MKRQSIAEQTLGKQITALDEKIDVLKIQMRIIEQTIDTTRNIRDQLRSEKDALYRARVAASQKAKP